MAEPDKEFVYQLTDWQNRLFGYLVTLLGNLHDARDVLQETNLVLCRKILQSQDTCSHCVHRMVEYLSVQDTRKRR